VVVWLGAVSLGLGSTGSASTTLPGSGAVIAAVLSQSAATGMTSAAQPTPSPTRPEPRRTLRPARSAP